MSSYLLTNNHCCLTWRKKNHWDQVQNYVWKSLGCTVFQKYNCNAKILCFFFCFEVEQHLFWCASSSFCLSCATEKELFSPIFFSFSTSLCLFWLLSFISSFYTSLYFLTALVEFKVHHTEFWLIWLSILGVWERSNLHLNEKPAYWHFLFGSVI